VPEAGVLRCPGAAGGQPCLGIVAPEDAAAVMRHAKAMFVAPPKGKSLSVAEMTRALKRARTPDISTAASGAE